MWLRWLALFTALGVMALDASAHRLNESYVYFNVSDEALSGRVEATLDDINKVVPLDGDGNGAISQDEVRAQASDVQAYLQPRLTLGEPGDDITVRFTTVDFLELDEGTYALFRFEVDGLESTPEAIVVDYTFLFDSVEPTHRGYAIIESNTRTGVEGNEAGFSLIFRPGDTRQELSLVGRPWHEVFGEFVIEGIWHIWIGTDHVLFLITFLLAAVMVPNRDGGWEPVDEFRSAFWNVAKIVSIFTVAHSVTLSLAALGVLQLNVVLVEAVIALSIAIVALDNIFPRFHNRAWLAIFFFGLFHGFGFANVLAPLGIDQDQKLAALAGFNIGVEIGQLAIVAVAFPILYLLRRLPIYIPLILRLGSALIIALALFWFFERTFDVFGDVTGTVLGLFG